MLAKSASGWTTSN
jgi:hypothetical protein